MNASEILEQARDTLTVRRVFGEPIERDGVVVVPVATVRGTAGAGPGEGGTGGQTGSGGGGGWGLSARPSGVFVIDGGEVRWQPALDLNRVILGGQIVAIIGLLVARSIIKAMRRR